MKRILLPLVALSIALTSCSRDNDDVIDNPITNPVAQGDLLTEINGEVFTGFTYNGNKLQSSIGGGEAHYTYEGDKITEITMNKGENVHGIRNLKFTYNSNGTLKTVSEIHTIKRRDSFAPTTGDPIFITYTDVSTRKYSYIGNNIVKIKEVINYFNDRDSSNSQPTKTLEYTLTMENGNLVRKDVSVNRTGDYMDYKAYNSYSATYRYDNKVNPLSKIKGLSAIAVELNLTDDLMDFHDISGYRNNLVYKNVDGTIDNYEYEYNDKGVPTKQTGKYIRGANSETFTEVRYYTYK